MKMEDYINFFYFRKATSTKIEDDLKQNKDELKKWKTANNMFFFKLKTT
jgi:hypothetical protein